MAKPIPFETYNRLEAEAVHALTLLEALFKGFVDAEQANIEDLAFIGMSLCENGQANIQKLTHNLSVGASQSDEERNIVHPQDDSVGEPVLAQMLSHAGPKAIMEWVSYLSKYGHDVDKTPFMEIIRNHYGPIMEEEEARG